MALISGKDVLGYEKRRYRSLDQWLVDIREQSIVREILPCLQPPTSHLQAILDLPCGYGRFSSILAQEGRFVISADLSPGMVVRARERLGGKGGYAVMDIRQLPLKNGSVDATFTMRLFHHGFAREQMGSLLPELARVTRRFVILSYYRPTFFHTLLRKIRGFKSRISMMSEAEFRQHVEKASLIIREQHRLVPFLHAQVIAVLEKKPF
jgi:SAM-dependent methyltransferase